MSENYLNYLKAYRRTKVIDRVLARFVLSVVMTLLIFSLNQDSFRNDPNTLKWSLITIWVDVFAYFLGFLRGFGEGATAIARTLIDDQDDIIGGKGDRHEE